MLQQPDGRFLRLFSALVIAAAITGGMLYGMNKVAETLRLRNPIRYFHISKVIIPKPTGPAKRPQAAQLPPPRATSDYGEQARRHPKAETGFSLPPPQLKTKPDQIRPPLTPARPSQQQTDQDAGQGQ